MAEQAAEPKGRPAFPYLLVMLALVAVAMALFNRLTEAVSPSCQNVVLEQLASPSGEWKAVLFERRCGEGPGFSSQVSVLRSDLDLPDQAGNALVAVDGVSAADSGWGGPLVALEWQSNELLLISYDPTATITSSRDSVAGIRVKFTARDP